jgi:hypothetical protein
MILSLLLQRRLPTPLTIRWRLWYVGRRNGPLKRLMVDDETDVTQEAEAPADDDSAVVVVSAVAFIYQGMSINSPPLD